MLFTASMYILTMAYAMVIWFRTNAFPEYLTLFGLGTLFYVNEFNKIKADEFDGTYVDFLSLYYKETSFFIRLIICPVCVSVWFGIIAALSTFNIILGLGVGPLSLLLYLIYSRLM